MNYTRRSFLGAGAAAALIPPRLFAAKKLAGLKIGVTDWNLQKAGKVEAIALARSLGFQGVEVSLGRTPVGDKLPLDNPEIQEHYLREAKAQKFALAGTCLDILHVNFLKNDKLGQKWVADGIPITSKLNARVMLMPFFAKGALETRAEREYVADILKELAPQADRAGVLLGLEDTISAEDNVRIMERSKSSVVRVYYDVGNAVKYGHDPVKEIRWLGKDRIAQFHLKDHNGYIGEGPIDFRPVMAAIADIDFAGFANLETASPSSIEDDMRRNLKAVRGFIEQVQGA